MKLKSILLSLAIASIALANSAVAKDWKTVRITTEGSYAPWNMTNSEGKLIGFEPEWIKIVCERVNVECELVPSDWDGMIPALTSGKFDMIMDAMGITEKRKEVIDFTIPYASSGNSFITSSGSSITDAPGTGKSIKMGPDDKDVAEIEALRETFKGKIIGIQAATSYSKFIYSYFADVAEIREYKTSAERDLDLKNGRIDLGFDDVIYVNDAMASDEGSLAFTGPIIAGPIWGAGVGLGVRQEDTDLRDKFNTAIKSTIEDGTIKELSLKWFKMDVTP